MLTSSLVVDHLILMVFVWFKQRDNIKDLSYISLLLLIVNVV